MSTYGLSGSRGYCVVDEETLLITTLAGISILPAPDGTFIHPRAADPTKLSSSHNRPAPEAVTSALLRPRVSLDT